MSNPAKSVTTQPTIIVFGVSAIGKPRAGTFKGSDIAAARKAAAKLGLAVIDVADQAGLALAAKVPAGRVGGSGDNIIPFINKDLHGQIKAFEIKGQKNGQAEASGELAIGPEAKGSRLPRSWDDIKAGDLVLAQEADPLDGWWQVTIIEANGDLFKLRWPGSGRGRPLQKHRATLGLICPNDAKTDGKSESKPNPKQSAGKSVYPANWSLLAVDQTVLAKEDGPMEQWWEAKIVKIDKDQFTLQWRDYPKLPQIVRCRSSLGLMHPAPKVA
jgi:Agenet domain